MQVGLRLDYTFGLTHLEEAWHRRLSVGERERLVLFLELLLEWGRRINLTGARTAEALVGEHLPDAFAVAEVLAGGLSVVDVGSGGGLPGIPFAVLRPDCQIVMVEPSAKKVAFLRTAVRSLGLQTVSILRGRFGSGARATWWAEGPERADSPAPVFDVAMSRATFPLEEWVALGATLVRPGGRVVGFATSPFNGPVQEGLLLEREMPYSLLDAGRRRLLVFSRACSVG